MRVYHAEHELAMVRPTHARGVVMRVLHVAHQFAMVHPTHARGVVMRVLHVAHQCHGAPHTRTHTHVVLSCHLSSFGFHDDGQQGMYTCNIAAGAPSR